MTRTIRRGADGAATPPDAAGVELGGRDTRKQHDNGGRASARTVTLGMFAMSSRERVVIVLRPAGRQTKVELRVHSRSGNLYFPTSNGLTLTPSAAEFVYSMLRDLRKSDKTIAEAAE